MAFQRKILNIPIRQARTPRIVTNQHAAFGKSLEPMPPDHAVPIKFEMCKPVRDTDQRWPLARRGKRDTYPITRSAELYALSHRGETDQEYSHLKVRTFPENPGAQSFGFWRFPNTPTVYSSSPFRQYASIIAAMSTRRSYRGNAPRTW
jgi:hypothetical protein